MSAEGHFCWESCDEGPHGCVCGNDCSPSIRNYTPTTERVCDRYTESAIRGGSSVGGVREQRAAFHRWLAAHDAVKRAEWEAEQGETEGRREFAAAYRARNGNVIPLGAETVVQDDANAVRAEFEREDPEGPAYFVATRILPPWLPVPDTTNNESEGKA